MGASLIPGKSLAARIFSAAGERGAGEVEGEGEGQAGGR